MGAFKSVLAGLAAGLAACAGVETLKEAEGAAHYYGEAAFFSPDGRIPYGSGELVLRREVLQNGVLIRETATWPGLSPGMPPEAEVTEFRRRGVSLIFDAVSGDGKLRGDAVFRDLRMGSWAWSLASADGGKITGSAVRSADGIRVEKRLSGAARPMAVKMNLKVISESEYRSRLREMLPAVGTE